MAGRFAERSRSRRRRERKPVVFIICEGSKTEIRYFKNFSSRNSLIEVRPIESKHKSALSLVKRAKDAIGQEPYSPEDGDQLWCVFDRDGNSDEQLQKADALAKRLKYNIVFSNPCFELWLLLHFMDHSAYLEDAAAVLKLLDSSKVIPNYKKSGDYYDVLRPLEEIASKRARSLIGRHEADGKSLISRSCNPCTTAVQLVEYLSERRGGAT
jgi:hypothetical protein